MTVLIFIIATEKYIRFFPKLKKTIQQYFLTDYKKVFYVFTNHDLENEVDVIYDKIFPLPWPLPSLLRFHLFSNSKLPDNIDLIYYFDVDTYLVDYIGNEVLHNKDEKISVVSHPYNLLDPNYNSFETNTQSTAFIENWKNYEYIHASFFGGYKDNFLSMCDDIKKLIDVDLKRNIIGKWYDESYLNKYVIDNKCKILDCGYSHPDFWAGDLPVKKKIIHLIKDWESIRGYRNEKTAGVCLIAVGDSCYAQYAYNLAASIKYTDEDAKIAVFTYGTCIDILNDEEKKIFDNIIFIKSEDLYINGRMHPNLFKLYLYKYTPFEYSVYMDVDSIWVSKFKFSQLVDNYIRDNINFVGQCRDVIDIREKPLLYGFHDTNKINLHFKFESNIAYQLHGQFVLFNKTEENIKFFEESIKIYLYQLDKKIVDWNWFNCPIEEFSMTVATLTLPFKVDDRVIKVAPVITQDENIYEIDKTSSKKLILTINGSETYDIANKIGGYVCISQDITQRYIKLYNQTVDEINNSSNFKLKYWIQKNCIL